MGEILVLGKFHIGDIVVSLANKNSYRYIGDIFEVLPNSTTSVLYYLKNTNSISSKEWRLATQEEINKFKGKEEINYEIY